MPALRKNPTMTCAASVAPDAQTTAAANDSHRQSAAAIIQQAHIYDAGRHLVAGDAVCALIASACRHDRATCDHSARMMHLAEAVATRLGRPDEERQIIRLAALLHDIGKIAVPAAIRHKPGPLTTEEWAVMRHHPEIGQHLLQQVGGSLDHIAPIVVAHHERWDGRGYPYGLAREAIPLSARILAVADSFDAMTSQRPYRAPITVAAARVELWRGAGSQFDPAVVAAFLSLPANEPVDDGD